MEEPGVRCLRSATDVDHIIPAMLGGGDEDGNLQALCVTHHRIKTGTEGRAAQGFRLRPDMVHPGLVDRRTDAEQG